MALQFRRVVTGHDATGRAIVKIDEIPKNLVSSRPGATSCVVWTSQGFPSFASWSSLRELTREIIAQIRSITPS